MSVVLMIMHKDISKATDTADAIDTARKEKERNRNLKCKEGVLLAGTKGIDNEAAAEEANGDANPYLHHPQTNVQAGRVRIILLTAIILCKSTSSSDTRL